MWLRPNPPVNLFVIQEIIFAQPSHFVKKAPGYQHRSSDNKIKIVLYLTGIARGIHGLLLPKIIGGCKPPVIAPSAPYLDGITLMIINKLGPAYTYVGIF